MQSPSLPPNLDAVLQPVQEAITDAMERLQIPGVGLGMWFKGQAYCTGFGVGNVDAPLAVTGDTLFQIGSITKTFTATAIMRLVDQGQIDLDVPVRTYLPDLALADEEVAATVTVRNLLQHTAGWEGDLFQDTGRGDDALAAYVSRMRTFPQLSPVGALCSYNNAALTLAGRVIEVVTGSVYETAVRALVLDPLGMTSTFFFPEEVMLRSFAVGHSVIVARPEVTRGPRPDIPRGAREWWALLRSCAPEGGLTSNVRDLLRYARFHLGDGTSLKGLRLLIPESLQAMQTPSVIAGPDTRVGLSWFIREIGGVRIVSHDGGTNGQIAKLVMAPEHELALAVLTNADSGGQLTREVERLVLAAVLGVEDPEPTLRKRSAAELEAYIGRYETPMRAVLIAAADGGLILEVVPGELSPDSVPERTIQQAQAKFYEDDRIVAVDGPLEGTRGEFLRDPDGQIAWFRMGRAYRRR